VVLKYMPYGLNVLLTSCHRCEKWVHMSSCNPNKVREMVTHLGTHLFIKDNSNVCTMLLICVGNHNILCLKVFILSQIYDKS